MDWTYEQNREVMRVIYEALRSRFKSARLMKVRLSHAFAVLVLTDNDAIAVTITDPVTVSAVHSSDPLGSTDELVLASVPLGDPQLIATISGVLTGLIGL